MSFFYIYSSFQIIKHCQNLPQVINYTAPKLLLYFTTKSVCHNQMISPLFFTLSHTIIFIIDMLPGSYSFNPGVGNIHSYLVLNPITMTPMVGSSSFTVNPLGVTSNIIINPAKPEQKVWQKMFIKDIPT